MRYKNVAVPALIFLVVALGAWLSRSLGWYNQYWFTDVILHILSGIGFGLIWLKLISKEKGRWQLVLGSIGFAALSSVMWEVWEFAGWRLMPAQTPFYIPEIGDSLGDILCGMVGGLTSSLQLLLSKAE